MNARGAALLVLLLLTPALGQEPPQALTYRFEHLAGKTAIYTVETELRQAVEHTGQAPAEGMRWRRDTLSQRYERRGSEGRVRQTSQRIELRVEAPGKEPVRYDTQEGGSPPEGLEGLTARLGQAVIVELTARGKVTKVRGAASESERASYEAAFMVWPRDPIAAGSEWTKLPLQRIDYPPFGALVYSTRYTLEAIEPNGRRRLRAETTVLFEPKEEEGDATPETRAVRISKQSGGGTLIFDADGLLLESRFRSELQITITQGQVVRVERATSETRQRLRSID